MRKSKGRVQEGYLASSDVNPDMGNWGVRLKWLRELLQESEVKQQIIILDCCYSGELLNYNEANPTGYRSRSRCFIAASREFESAYERLDNKHSVLTAALLEGLKPKQGGCVTSATLVPFLEQKLNPKLNSFPQRPVFIYTGEPINLTFGEASQSTPVKKIDETCPYQGLKAFDQHTAKFFFGRKQIVQMLIEKLEQSTFVPLIGVSGSGKSSVVLAGLIPELKKNNWSVLNPIKPGLDPIPKLKAALEEFFREKGQLQTFQKIYSKIDTEGLRPVIEQLPGSEQLLLVVDQFEEVFVSDLNEENRRRFVELLTQVTEFSSRLSVVTTMRSDFIESYFSYASLAHLIQEYQVIALPMEEFELKEAITEPAKLQGYQFEKGLLEIILSDVHNEKNCLPLLQFALTELWKYATEEEHKITVEQYNKIGGLTGALNGYANTIYEKFNESEKRWVKRICLKLVRTGRQENDYRERRWKKELLDLAGEDSKAQQVTNQILQVLIDGRLLVTGEQQGEAWVDLAHEALMERWKLFNQWLQEDRDLRRMFDKIEDEAQIWKNHNKNQDFLMNPGSAAEVNAYMKILDQYLSSLAKEFCSKTLDKINSEESQKKEYERLVNESSEKLTDLEKCKLRIRVLENELLHAESQLSSLRNSNFGFTISPLPGFNPKTPFPSEFNPNTPPEFDPKNPPEF